MKTAKFMFDGREFEILPSVHGDYCHVYIDGEIFLEGDSGCEDYYGEPAELVDWFKEKFQDEKDYEPEVWASRFELYSLTWANTECFSPCMHVSGDAYKNRVYMIDFHDKQEAMNAFRKELERTPLKKCSELPFELTDEEIRRNCTNLILMDKDGEEIEISELYYINE